MEDLVQSHGDSTVVHLEFINFHEHGFTVSVDFSIMTLSSLAHVFPPCLFGFPEFGLLLGCGSRHLIPSVTSYSCSMCVLVVFPNCPLVLLWNLTTPVQRFHTTVCGLLFIWWFEGIINRAKISSQFLLTCWYRPNILEFYVPACLILKLLILLCPLILKDNLISGCIWVISFAMKQC